MSSRPYLCPACQKPLGVMTRWAYRGAIHAKLRTAGRSVLVEKTWRGTYISCNCGKRIRLADDVEVSVR
jgi:hypothetical protein